MTLVEVALAISVMALSATVSLSVMGTTATVDEEMRDRALALRAAVTQMEKINGYDYDGDIGNLTTWLAAPAQANFAVDGLALPMPGYGVPTATTCGTVSVDTTDPLRVSIDVSVRWQGRRGIRSLSLPMIVTEVIP